MNDLLLAQTSQFPIETLKYIQVRQNIYMKSLVNTCYILLVKLSYHTDKNLNPVY